MRGLVLFVGAGVLALSLYSYNNVVSKVNEIDNVQTASIEALHDLKSARQNGVQRFEVWENGLKTNCSVELKQGASVNENAVSFGASCPKISSQFSKVKSAQITPNGDLNFVDTSGAPMIEFMQGEGFAYESVLPSHMLLALDASK